MSDQGTTRREVITKAVYVAPLLITLKANLAFAATGSGLQAPSDDVFTGGSGPPESVAPGGSPSPPRQDPPPAGSEAAPPDDPAPVSTASPSAEHTGSDAVAPPPQDDPAADGPWKRRRPGRHRRWHVR
jgi:hypothetical protein